MLVFAAGDDDNYTKELDVSALKRALGTQTYTTCSENSCIAELLDEATAVIHLPSFPSSFEITQQIAVSKWYCPPVIGLEKLGNGWRVRYLKKKSPVMPAEKVPEYIEEMIEAKRHHVFRTRVAFLCFLLIVSSISYLCHFSGWGGSAFAKEPPVIINK